RHDARESFTFDFAKARGGNDVNPFVGAAAAPSPAGSASGGGGASKGGNGSNSAARVLVVHGVLASLAFVVLFPAGAISIRVMNFHGLIRFHAAVQCVAYLVFIVAFGLGLYMAIEFGVLDNAHPRIGIFLLLVLAFQPPLGYVHHIYFKRLRRRTLWSYAHLWLGRIAITLGIVNGALGLQLANNTQSGKVAYSVVAVIVWVAYVAAMVHGERKRKRSILPPYIEIGLSPAQSTLELQAHDHYRKSS
ncbi:hypothetical protein LTR66_008568, partial [Elasticomyces elasticus]